VATIPTPLSPELFDYVVAHGSTPDDVQAALIAETRALGDPAGLQISPDEGAFLTLFTRIIGARRAIEVGTFTGYSALCITRGMGPSGRMTCCDVSEEWTSIARKYWEKDGISDQIELKLGPGVETLRALPSEPVYDLAFIDADKPSYPQYWEELVPRVKPGGVILVDNALMHGGVVAADPDRGSAAVTELNDRALADDRVDAALITIADGIMMARKR
jgi:caffeoyl-CoA O-methyltransferase